MNVAELTNDEVTRGIKNIVNREREDLALFLSFLIEVEKRELQLKEGYSTIQDFLMRGLGLSHGTALKRMWVARAAFRFPLILEYLKSGRLHLTGISHLCKHLTFENQKDLLEGALGKSEPELRWWLASLFPDKTPADWRLNGKEKLLPFDGETAKFQLVVDREFVELLKRHREIHKHKVPDGNALEILKRALREDLERHDPEKRQERRRRREEKRALAPVKKETVKKENPEPRTGRATTQKDNRNIPHGIKDRAFERYGYQCAYVSQNGVRCTERAGLEGDHKIAWAKGGSSNEVFNIAPLCFSHNRWKARKEFGRDFRV